MTDIPDTRSRRGESWTNEERRMLLARFDRGDSLEEMADVHCRTEAALLTELVKLGKLHNDGTGVYRHLGPVYHRSR